MMDISNLLTTTMKNKHCTSLCAFLMFKEGDESGVHLHKPKSVKQSDGRLRDTRDKSVNEAGLGNNVHEHGSTRVHDARHAIF